MDKKKKDSSFVSGDPTKPDALFPIPPDVKSSDIIAAYKAGVPPVFDAGRKPSINTRGMVVKLNKINAIKESTQKPARALPPYYLPAWKNLSPSIKLPDTRHRTRGKIYYTRGKLGEKLHIPKPEYDLTDPINKRKVLDTYKYSALHDPHCQSYFRRPNVLKHLKQQKLVNERGEVLCDVNEFNQYRSYLGELFNDQVKRRIDDNRAMEDLEREINKSICTKQARKRRVDHMQYRQTSISQMNQEKEALRLRHIAKMDTWKRRLRQIERYRAQTRLANAGKYTKKHWNAYLLRQKAAEADEQKKQQLLVKIAYAETKNDYVCKYDKFVRLALMERYKADQAVIMVARDDQVQDMEELVHETFRRVRTGWLNKYNHYVNKCRDFPLRMQAHLLEAEQRKKYLKKKYFYMWIHFVLRRRSDGSDPLHVSSFKVWPNLKLTVQDLSRLPKDFNPNRECADGDKACKKLVRRDLERLERVGKIPSTNQLTETIEIKKPRKILRKARPMAQDKPKVTATQQETDGKEADDEPDEYIDKMIARYELDKKQLESRLAGRLEENDPLERNPQYVPKVLFSVKVEGDLNDEQVDQKENIQFLTDINQVSKKFLY